MDRLVRISWVGMLRRIARPLNPAHRKMFGPGMDYYWTVHQSEWATDILFRSPQTLASIYPSLVRGGIAVLGRCSLGPPKIAPSCPCPTGQRIDSTSIAKS